MSESITTAVHVGFSKTGTTTLQRHVFTKHSQVRFPGKPYVSESFKTELYKLIRRESTVYDPSALKALVSAEIAAAETDASQKVMLVSDEIMVSYSKVRDRGVVARRLKEVFGDCKILFTIRGQLDILKTAYLNRGWLLKNVPPRYDGLFVGMAEWLELSDRDRERSYIGHVDYFKTIDYYRRLFGKENVCVLPLELFAADKAQYLERLAAFLGIDAAEALATVGDAHEKRDVEPDVLGFEQFKTRWFPISRLPFGAALLKPFYVVKRTLTKTPDIAVIPAPWRERLSDFYREGNRRLNRDFDLRLEAYGYPI